MVVIVNPTDWHAGSPIYYLLGVGNDTYDVHNAGSGYTYDLAATYAMTAIDNDSIRFEVRAGDHNWYDSSSGSERSEISSRESIDYDTPIHVSYGFTLEPGSTNTAKWMVIGQIHQVFPDGVAATSPPFSIQMSGEKMIIVLGYTDKNGNYASNIVYRDTADIVRGHEYSIDINIVFDSNGAGRLVVTRDGVTIANYSGPLGYSYGGEVYWKEGVYRAPAAETTAATYSNLEVTHGEMVDIPAAGATLPALKDAPTLTFLSAETKGNGGTVVLTGSAPAGSTLRIYDGEKLLATAVASADGQYTATAALSAGSHILTSTTVGTDGLQSNVSHDVAVEVGTSAEILARMDTVAALADLKSVILTNGSIFTVASVAQMMAMVAADSDVLSKISGGATFQFYTGLPGSRTLTTYDSHGSAISATTTVLQNGILARETTVYYDEHAPLSREVSVYNIAGKTYASTYQAVDSAGLTISLVRYHADGTLDYRLSANDAGAQTIENYNAAGLLLNATITHAIDDGTGLSREVFSYNITGQSYVSVYQSYGTNGALIDSTRTHANGTLDYESHLDLNGTKTVKTYALDGSVSNTTITKIDGSAISTTFNPAGEITTLVVTNADKSSHTEIFSHATLVSESYGYAAGSAILKEQYSYNVANSTFVSTYQAYGTGNKLTKAENYHADGTLDYAYQLSDDGATITRKFDATGVITSEVVVLANKTTDTKLYTSGLLTKDTILYKIADSNGAVKVIYEFNVIGKAYGSRMISYDAGNKVVALVTHAEAVFTTALADSIPAYTPVVKHVAADTPAETHIIDAPVLAEVAATATPLLTGVALAGEHIAVFDNDKLLTSVSVGKDGTFHIDLTDVGRGVHTFTVTANDDNGGNSSVSNKINVNIDAGDDSANVLTGTVGSDWLFGKHGADTYIVNNVGDIVTETEQDGVVDTVLASISYHLTDNIENLTLTGTDSISAAGNDLDNVLIGNSGNNVLNGGSGADHMEGGKGDDIYIVDNVGDTVKENAREGIDHVISSVSFTLSDNIENLTLIGSSAIDATGNDLANILIGNSGNNTLSGGLSADTMIGGDGNDIYYVQDAGDTVIEVVNQGSDAVYSSISYTLADNVEYLQLLGNANINATGNSLDNSLRGNSGANILDGGAGADRLEGRGGDDIYIVDNRADKVIEYADQGNDTVISSVAYTLSANVENLIITGTANVAGSGNNVGNVLIGNAGNNTLSAGDGNDRLDGGLGNDILIGGNGADIFQFSTALSRGNMDTISDFALGQDKIQLSSSIVSGLTPGELINSAFKDTASGTVDANDKIIYDSSTGALWYDADGSGSQAAVQFASVANKAHLSAHDFLIV